MNITELIFENTMLKLSLIEQELNEEFRKLEQNGKPTKQQMEEVLDKYLETKDDLTDVFRVIENSFYSGVATRVLLDCYPDEEEIIVDEVLDKVDTDLVLDRVDDYLIREWIYANYSVEDLVEWR